MTYFDKTRPQPQMPWGRGKAATDPDGQVPHAAYATRVSDLVYPLTISHRGGPNIYPENSWEAKEGSVSFGFVPEFDLQLLADGKTLVSCHDATVDRTMNNIGKGLVNTKTVAEWKRARIKPAVPGGREGRPIIWDEVLDRWGGQVVLVPELKDSTAAHVLIEGIVQRGLQHSVIAQSFDWQVARRLAGANIETLFLSDAYPTQTPREIVDAGIDFVGGSISFWTTADVVAMQAAGLKVLLYTVNTVDEANTPLALAADGLFSNDAWLTTESIPVQSGDPFDQGIRPYGMGAPYRSGGTEVLSPKLRLAGRALGWSTSPASVTYARAPWVGVVTRPVRLSLRIHFGPSTDQTENAGFVLLGDAATRTFADGASSGQNALLFVVRRDGRLGAWKYVDGAAAAALAAPTIPAVPFVRAGTEGIVDLSVVLDTAAVRVHAQGGSTVADLYVADTFTPTNLGLVLRWPGTEAPGFPGFLSDISVAPLA
jgi:glycerophosphoryl diester phosphodiesterase